MDSVERSIGTLPEQVAALPADEAARFNDLFSVTRSYASLTPPPEMEAWITAAFGSLEAVKSQAIVKTLNRWTLEGSLFNDLRARRPVAHRAQTAQDLAGDGSDPFCNPLTGTPEDTFGRVKGSHSITASNVAKYDGLHSVVILKGHNPLEWSEEQICDAFDTASRWIMAAHDERPSAVYPFIMWNGGPRSGASQVHAHMQATLGEGSAYARLEIWRRAGQAYRAMHARNYFEDLFLAHESVGLTGTSRMRNGEFGMRNEDESGNIPDSRFPIPDSIAPVRWLAHLTPVKEKETILLSGSLNEGLYKAVYRTLRLFIDTLGVRAFNVAVYMPPLGHTGEDWSDFPVTVRIVDRGDPASSTSDIGAMELFAQPVVTFDPWKLASVLAVRG